MRLNPKSYYATRDRNLAICRMRCEKSMTIYELSKHFGLSKSRIHQILEDYLDIYLQLSKERGKKVVNN